MTNPRHAADKPLYPTKRAVLIILGLGVILGILIVVFLVIPAFQPVPGHVAPHVHPTTGRIIAKTPQIKAKTLTAVQLHAHHLQHVRHLAYLHAEHVRHLAHLAYVKYSTFEYQVKL